MGLVAASCGGSSGSPSDAGEADIAHKGMGAIVSDGGDDSGDAGSSGLNDGTTGMACKTDADCIGDGGPGVNKCSNGLGGTIGGVTVTVLPTPVCILPTCNPAPDTDPTGSFLHFCDGPDDPSSPGLCIPTATQGQGICLPACSFAFDGSAPTGCVGKDICNPIAQNTDTTTGAVTGGLGFCQGICETNTDCSALGTGWVCQTDIGFCTQHLKTRTKNLGDACTSGTTACNCLADQTTDTGFCTTACIVGGTVACPAGWACDDGESNILMDNTPVATENVQTAGNCFPLCTMGDAGVPEAAVPEAAAPVDGSTDSATDAPVATPDAGVAPLVTCPADSICQVETPIGPECTP
jgi:hypothetical protein